MVHISSICDQQLRQEYFVKTVFQSYLDENISSIRDSKYILIKARVVSFIIFVIYCPKLGPIYLVIIVSPVRKIEREVFLL